MTFLNTSLIRKSILFFVAAILSVSAMAADFNQTQTLANQGDASAQHNLGWMYKNGEGVRQDYAKAVEWYTKAANQGNASAQYNIGLMYYGGEGVRQDYAKAAEF
uniref:tetratricopeptide repeat protein n=1 Tax=uncultured Psychrobacter sp. TaxID=259303 RepID=UPI0025971FFC